MKWVITGILAVSAAAALASGHVALSNDDGEASGTAIQPKEDGDTPAAEAIAKERAFMTFSNEGGGTPRGGSYTTRGGCIAYRAPEVEHRAIQGAVSLRFLESAYIHHVAGSIEAAGGKCTCELRFPTWDAALEELEMRFMTLPSDERSAWVRDYANSDRSRLTREVDKLCKVQGVY